LLINKDSNLNPAPPSSKTNHGLEPC
jgi:hypothetical protein